MASARHHSDGSVGSEGAHAKEAKSFEDAVHVHSNMTSKEESSDLNAPLELTEANCIEYTAYAWSPKKKWAVLTVVALCQTSMSKFKSKPQSWLTLRSCN
jgi:hypothetical protein